MLVIFRPATPNVLLMKKLFTLILTTNILERKNKIESVRDITKTRFNG